MKTAVGDGRLGLSIHVIRVFQILRGETESYFDRVLLRQTAEKFQYISILFQISIRENQDIGVSLHYNTVHLSLIHILQRLFVIALSAEIKTVLIGFCFAWEGRSPWVYAPMIWGVSTIVAVLGFTYGYHVGCRFWKALTGIGGIFLILASLGVYFHLI